MQLVADLLLIAGTCPKIGGAAVFKARGIVAMYSDTIFVDDDALCAQQGVQYRIGQTTTTRPEISFVSIFPNPTKNLLTVRVKLEEMEPCIIKISNTLGPTEKVRNASDARRQGEAVYEYCEPRATKQMMYFWLTKCFDY